MSCTSDGTLCAGDSVSGDGFVGAAAALFRAGDDGDLCDPFLAALPIRGVAISTLGDPIGSETVCASDAVAAQLDEIQLDLGEGPCWEAMTTGRPVLEPDMQAATTVTWPLALSAMRELRLGAAFAFPMRLGDLDIGAVDLYHDEAFVLPPRAVEHASVLAEGAARQVLRRALARADSDTDGDSAGDDISEYSRREVYQASGMLAAQTGVRAEDALLLLRAHAFAMGRTVMDLSADIIARTVDFTGQRANDRDDSAS